MGLASMAAVSKHQMARTSAIVTKDGMVLNATCQVGLFVVSVSLPLHAVNHLELRACDEASSAPADILYRETMHRGQDGSCLACLH